MTRMVMTAKVGPDGVLHLALPATAADQEVQVTVEPVSPKKAMTQEEWRAAIMATAGRWQGDFERPEPGKLEERESLP